jgi:hypothetical protein
MTGLRNLGFYIHLVALIQGSWMDQARYWDWEARTGAGIARYPALRNDPKYRAQRAELCRINRDACVLRSLAFPGCATQPLALV